MKNKTVFYISGFDPRGVRYHYNLYKRNFKKVFKAGTISKYEKKDELYEWNINTEESNTQYIFLDWQDIISKEWASSTKEKYLNYLLLFKTYILTGLLFKFFKKTKKQTLIGLYPFMFITMTFLLNLFISYKISTYIPEIYKISSIFMFLVLFYIFHISAKKLGVFWLLDIYTFCDNYSNNNIKGINERLKNFEEKIKESLLTTDEIILASHSVGTILAIDLLSKMINEKGIEKLSMLTLGECIPLVSINPKSTSFRNNLKKIMERNVKWDDYTSPIDGACFPLYDFTEGHKNKVNIISTRFHTLFSKETYKRLRKDMFNVHFMYFEAPENDIGFNYYRIISD